MESRGFWHLGDVSDTQLRNGLSELLATGYRTEARIVAHLAEVEQRKLHLSEGSESLFDYCTRVRHLSNSEAFHRITAARIARKFPMVFELLENDLKHAPTVDVGDGNKLGEGSISCSRPRKGFDGHECRRRSSKPSAANGGNTGAPWVAMLDCERPPLSNERRQRAFEWL